MDSLQSRIAQKFADLLRAYLSAEAWASLCRANADLEPDDSICCSHDYCDANEFMLEAFETFMDELPFADPDVDCLDAIIHEDAMNALWNAAWEEAKRLHFTA